MPDSNWRGCFWIMAAPSENNGGNGPRTSYEPTRRPLSVALPVRPGRTLPRRPSEFRTSVVRNLDEDPLQNSFFTNFTSGDGYLEIDVNRLRSEEPGFVRAHVEVEVANFYPSLARWVARWFYSATWSRSIWRRYGESTRHRWLLSRA